MRIKCHSAFERDGDAPFFLLPQLLALQLAVLEGQREMFQLDVATFMAGTASL